MRIVANTGVGVVEQQARFGGGALSFTTSRDNVAFANLCDEAANVDFHVYLDMFEGYAFERRAGRRGPWLLYYIHLLGREADVRRFAAERHAWLSAYNATAAESDVDDHRLAVTCSLMLLWEPGRPKGAYEPETVEAWEAMAKRWSSPAAPRRGDQGAAPRLFAP